MSVLLFFFLHGHHWVLSLTSTIDMGFAEGNALIYATPYFRTPYSAVTRSVHPGVMV